MDAIFGDDSPYQVVGVEVVESVLDVDDASDEVLQGCELHVAQHLEEFLVEQELAEHDLLSCEAEDFRLKEKLFYIQCT